MSEKTLKILTLIIIGIILITSVSVYFIEPYNFGVLEILQLSLILFGGAGLLYGRVSKLKEINHMVTNKYGVSGAKRQYVKVTFIVLILIALSLFISRIILENGDFDTDKFISTAFVIFFVLLIIISISRFIIIRR